MPDSNIVIPKQANAAIVMADGTLFFGQGIGAKGTSFGEICFNTSLTGYQETLTDPSYAGQIITFTFPHIGNVGTNGIDVESNKPAVRGLIVREPITAPSNYRNNLDLQSWLEKHKITGICGVDTRAITRHIRIHGPQNIAIIFGTLNESVLTKTQNELSEYPSLAGMELAKTVTTDKSYRWAESSWDGENDNYENVTAGSQSYKVVVLDFGVKYNILRCLAEVGCDVTVVPSTATATEILAHKPDGVFLSNGPGDPAATAEYALDEIKALLDANVPIFGICLGHQLLARALGGETTKMHQGHRGANQPVKRLSDNQVEITSQNHGFVVTNNIDHDDIEITHLSLFDQTVEGLKSKSKAAFSVQHHPEASPGPRDSFYLFGQFTDLMKQHKEKR